MHPKSKQKNLKDATEAEVCAEYQSNARPTQLDDSICRVCLDAKGTISLFDCVGADEQFRYCTLLTVERNDGLPNKLCKLCMDNMRTAYDFRFQAVYANEYFRRIIFLPSLKEEESDDQVESTKQQVNALELDENLQEIETLLKDSETPADEAGLEEVDALVNNIAQNIKADGTETSDDGLSDHFEQNDACSSNSDTSKATVKKKQLTYLTDETSTNATSQVAELIAAEKKRAAPSSKKCAKKNGVIKNVECNICGASFSQTNSLKYHLQKHSFVRPYKCEFCPKSYKRRFTLSVHRRTHTGEKPYKCDECIEQFHSKDAVDRHKKYDHKGSLNAPEFKCRICLRVLCSNSSLKHHLSSKHPPESKHSELDSTQPEPSLRGSKPGRSRAPWKRYCKICQEAFTSGAQLRAHEKQHEVPKLLNCTTCQSSFAKKYQLLEHIQLHENAEMLLQELQSIRKEKLKESMGDEYSPLKKPRKKKSKSFENKVNDFESPRCHLCRRLFTHIRLYKTHIQHHCVDTLHNCDYCSETFRRKTLLLLHMKRHKGGQHIHAPSTNKTKQQKLKQI